MAQPLTLEQRTGRCPVCLIAIRLPENCTAADPVRCKSCNSTFSAGNLLSPIPNESSPSAALPLEAELVKGGSVVSWMLVGIVLAGGVGAVTSYGRTLRGPEFLGLFAVVGAVLLIASWILRRAWGHEWSTSILACAAFEAVGGLRILLGYQAGMRKFGFLAIMMALGGLLFFLRAKQDGGLGVFGGCGLGCGGYSGGGGRGGGCGGGGCGGGCGGCGS